MPTETCFYHNLMNKLATEKCLFSSVKYVYYALEHKLCASVQNSVIQKVDNYALSCTRYTEKGYVQIDQKWSRDIAPNSTCSCEMSDHCGVT